MNRVGTLPYLPIMPELPEVENVRRTLADRLAGRRVVEVAVHRSDVVVGMVSPTALLAGDRLAKWDRRGKQLAIHGDRGRVVCVHLGMTGQLRAMRHDDPRAAQPHTHITWRLEGRDVLTFRDPRRFGGVWTFPSEPELHAGRWAGLGEDALTIGAAALAAVLSRKRLAIKAALLDQRVVAGLGNIYVDELLFARGIHPLTPAGELDVAQVRGLVRAMRRLLARAIEAGGSSLRDYVDGNGNAGGFQERHRVYGRGGQPCPRCRRVLETLVIGGRTTTCCVACQRLPRGLRFLLKEEEI